MTKHPHLLQISDRGKGILMSVVGIVILSPDSLFIRLAGLDSFTLIFYRGLFPVFAISLLLWFYYRQRFLSVCLGIGWAGLLNGVFFTAIQITFINAIQQTSVANTLLILSSIANALILPMGKVYEMDPVN